MSPWATGEAATLAPAWNAMLGEIFTEMERDLADLDLQPWQEPMEEES